MNTMPKLVMLPLREGKWVALNISQISSIKELPSGDFEINMNNGNCFTISLKRMITLWDSDKFPYGDSVSSINDICNWLEEAYKCIVEDKEGIYIPKIQVSPEDETFPVACEERD